MRRTHHSVTILAALKLATADSHARAEAALPSLERLADAAIYCAVLRRFQGFYAAWEPAVWSSSSAERLFGAERSHRLKLPLLNRDLDALRIAPMVRDDLPRVRLTDRAALGAMYVMEGATLGGRVILRHVAATLAVGPSTGAAFFHGYGEETGARWRAFGDRMNAFIADAGGDDEIIVGAQDCFAAFEQWFRAPALTPTALMPAEVANG
jgi:heme oxygenase